MNPELVKNHSKTVLLVGLVVLALVGIGLLGYKVYSDQTSKNKAGGSLGDGPMAAIEKDRDSDRSNTTTNSAAKSSFANQRIKEANDRKAQSEVRSLATGIEACRTVELSNGVSASAANQNCDTIKELAAKDLLSPQYSVNPEIFITTNSAATNICVYALNKNGNGVVSYDSSIGSVTEAGKGKTTCS